MCFQKLSRSSQKHRSSLDIQGLHAVNALLFHDWERLQRSSHVRLLIEKFPNPHGLIYEDYMGKSDMVIAFAVAEEEGLLAHERPAMNIAVDCKCKRS